jgi:arsenate reductase
MNGAREDHHLREADLKHLPRGQAGLDREELKKILREAGLKPQDAVRGKELKELAGERKLSDDELIAFMAKHPEVIQRPLVVKGSKAVLARPVERLGDLGL